MELSPALGPLHQAVTQAIETLRTADTVQRMWDGDHTLWADEPTEITDRLGWLHAPERMDGAISELEMFAAGVRADGLTKAVVCGMGGSSLFPEVLAKTFAGADGLPLAILDTTDPAAIDRVLSDREITETLFIGASKSGTTIETRSQLDTFWSRLQRGSQFTVITDPGSELIPLADRCGFRRVFLNPADIGGRFSALSYFGLMPGALVGAPIARIVGSALKVTPLLQRPEPSNPGVVLGAALAVAAKVGRDKATILIDERVAPFGVWLEQLLAESTGKFGTGIVPIVDEPPSADAYGTDRFFATIGNPAGVDQIPAGSPLIGLSLTDATDLGEQVLVWEFATAVAGVLLGVNPFDQPNVASAKTATRDILASGAPAIPLTTVPQMLSQLSEGDYLNVIAYVDAASSAADRLRRKGSELGRRYGVASTFGIGPRYLHSTGQLHKGKPRNALTIQILGEDRNDVPITGQPFTFAQLKAAQAAGDYLALQGVGGRVGRVVATEFLDA